MGVYIGQSTKIYHRETGEISRGRVPGGSVVVPGSLPAADGSHSLYCAVIVKQVDEQDPRQHQRQRDSAQCRVKTGIHLHVYGIRNCDSCRCALKWLETRKVPHTFHDFREEGLTEELLKAGWHRRMRPTCSTGAARPGAS